MQLHLLVHRCGLSTAWPSTSETGHLWEPDMVPSIYRFKQAGTDRSSAFLGLAVMSLSFRNKQVDLPLRDCAQDWGPLRISHACIRKVHGFMLRNSSGAGVAMQALMSGRHLPGTLPWFLSRAAGAIKRAEMSA